MEGLQIYLGSIRVWRSYRDLCAFRAYLASRYHSLQQVRTFIKLSAHMQMTFLLASMLHKQSAKVICGKKQLQRTWHIFCLYLSSKLLNWKYAFKTRQELSVKGKMVGIVKNLFHDRWNYEKAQFGGNKNKLNSSRLERV